MNNQEARFILQAYRPGGQDAADPQFKEALEQAQRDPELGNWLEEERALDTAISARVKAIAIPADLKASILAGNKIIRPKTPWHKSPALAAMVCAVLLLIAAGYWVMAANSFDRYRQDMTVFLGTSSRLDLETSNLDEIKGFLATHHSHKDLALPVGLEKLSINGCKLIDWHGKPVTMMSFHSTTNNLPGEVFLLVIDQADLRKPPPLGFPIFSQNGNWATASWSDERHSFILAGTVKPEILEAYAPQTHCH